MWWTHHLTEEKRVELRQQATVRSPVGEKSVVGALEATEGQCLHLEQANSCDWCHSARRPTMPACPASARTR